MIRKLKRTTQDRQVKSEIKRNLRRTRCRDLVHRFRSRRKNGQPHADLWSAYDDMILALSPETANWIESAEYDLQTAQHMFSAGRYIYVVFMCHLALEKILKAHVVEVTRQSPARTHDLLYLVKKADLDLPGSHLEFVGRINNASIPTRYPHDIRRVLREYDEPVARQYLEKTTEVLGWLRQHPNLQE